MKYKIVAICRYIIKTAIVKLENKKGNINCSRTGLSDIATLLQELTETIE